MTAQRLALSIAGSDPTGGAGLQQDLQIFRSLGVHGCAIPTALTVQDTSKVHQVLPTFPSVILEQIRALVADLPPHALKLGMLATDDVLRSVEYALGDLAPEVPLVIDPILLASDGTPLLEQRAWPGLGRLCARATLVTPNRPEAEALLGREIGGRQRVEDGARAFVEELGARAALIKGGHAGGDPHDCLAVADEGGTRIRWIEGTRIEVGSVHGTGCALSAAITARRALGATIDDAVDMAHDFVAQAIRNSWVAGGGARLLDWPLP